MNRKIIDYILIVYLFIQPFLDVIAITKINYINVAIRGLFFIFMFVYLLFNKKFRPLIVLLGLSSLVISVYGLINNQGLYSILSSTMKLYYLPITLIFFYTMKTNFSSKYLTLTLTIYIALFLSSYVFGFGYNNYLDTDGKSGFRGVFNSINEISAIIIGLLPISLDYLKKNKKLLLAILLMISVLMVALLTGTKVLMVGFIIIFIFSYAKDIYNIVKKLSRVKKMMFGLLMVLILLVGGYLVTKTRFYNNMLIQAKFFNVTNIFTIDFINRVVFNDRLTFLKDNFNYFLNQGIANYIFGIGYFNSFKLVEIDIFDILFRYGIFGLLSFLLPCYIVLKNKFDTVSIFSIIFLLLISLTSGHVLLSPNVCIYFGYLVIKMK